MVVGSAVRHSAVEPRLPRPEFGPPESICSKTRRDESVSTPAAADFPG